MKYTAYIEITGHADVEASNVEEAEEKLKDFGIDEFDLEFSGDEFNIAYFPDYKNMSVVWVDGPYARQQEDIHLSRTVNSQKYLDVVALLRDGEAPEEEEFPDAL